MGAFTKIFQRLKLTADTNVSTQTTTVIAADTTNSSLVIAPNGTGALVAQIPDGTVTGGNARGSYALDLQRVRTLATQVPAGFTSYSTILNGQNNFVNASHSSILSGNGNTVNFSSGYSTVINGLNCVTNGDYSLAQGYQSVSSNFGVSLGYQNNLTGQFGFVTGRDNIVSGAYSVAFNRESRSINEYTFSYGKGGFSYLYGQSAHGSINTFGGTFYGNGQSSEVIATKENTLTTASTTNLSLDGTGVTNLIIPNGNNRAWNVQVNWVAVVTTITGTATGITVGDVITSIDLLAFKRIGGISSASTHTSTATKLMVTTPANYAACAIAFTAGASQEMALTFTGPTFVGDGSVTMRVVARIELTEVAF